MTIETNDVQDTSIQILGRALVPSPQNLSKVYGDGIGNFVPEDARVHFQVETGTLCDAPDLRFEKAGPREFLFFKPEVTRAAIVTCGGLCPGLNNVIRSVTLELYENYGVRDIMGLRYGYAGLNPDLAEEPIPLNPETVDEIQRQGGTILGSSRGAQPEARMVDYLEENEIDILFCMGGDGTQRGMGDIADEVKRRGLHIAVVGIPKTIDNDIRFVHTSFGYSTAIDISHNILDGAHMEARSALNGMALVKLMGRDSGFIAAGATLASQDVNFALIPEVPFDLEAFLNALRDRVRKSRHALIVVAEGAGQDLLSSGPEQFDASGNQLHQDIGLFLKQKIAEHFKKQDIPFSIKYIDPSYIIRNAPANCTDSLLCDCYARHAVHAAMAGKTGLIIGYANDAFMHVPVHMVTSDKQFVQPEGRLWSSVMATTRQPRRW